MSRGALEPAIQVVFFPESVVQGCKRPSPTNQLVHPRHLRDAKSTLFQNQKWWFRTQKQKCPQPEVVVQETKAKKCPKTRSGGSGHNKSKKGIRSHRCHVHPSSHTHTHTHTTDQTQRTSRQRTTDNGQRTTTIYV
jgi:hypothetical protein